MRQVRPVHVPAVTGLPNLVIAGVAKAGTTSLFRYLAQHPDVGTAENKELRYFAAIRYGEPLAPLATYARHFRHCADRRYRMEATPGYFAGGRPVAVAMDEALPEARIVVCLRDPVQRCWSWFRFVRSTARISKDMSFPDYLDRCMTLHADGTDGTRENQPFWGLGGGCYDRWVDEWIDVFGDRFRVAFFETLVADPRGVVEGLCQWLDIDPSVGEEIRYEVENRTVQYRNKPLQQAALALNRRGESFFGRHPALKRTVRDTYYRLNGGDSVSGLDPASRERLEAFYRPHNARLHAALSAAGRADEVTSLPGWLATENRPT